MNESSDVRPHDIQSAYRFILGREPESQVNLEFASQQYSDWRDLRAEMYRSAESVSLQYDNVFASRQQWCRVSTHFGRRIYLNLSDIAVSKVILLESTWEPHVGDLLSKIVRDDDVFLDCGANIGWFSLFVGDKMARAGAGGRVISCEANPTVLPYLYASVVESGLSDVISVMPYALSNSCGLAEMWAGNAGNIGGLNIAPKDQSGGQKRVNIVPTVRLDDLLMSLERLDVIKIDIEGAEYMAMEGARELLARFSPVIVMEINQSGLRQVSGVDVSAMLDLMRSMNYHCQRFVKGMFMGVSDGEVTEEVERLGYCDFCFVKHTRNPGV